MLARAMRHIVTLPPQGSRQTGYPSPGGVCHSPLSLRIFPSLATAALFPYYALTPLIRRGSRAAGGVRQPSRSCLRTFLIFLAGVTLIPSAVWRKYGRGVGAELKANLKSPAARAAERIRVLP